MPEMVDSSWSRMVACTPASVIILFQLNCFRVWALVVPVRVAPGPGTGEVPSVDLRVACYTRRGSLEYAGNSGCGAGTP